LVARFVGLLTLLASEAGCGRGCGAVLRSWVGGREPERSGTAAAAGIGRADCPDGLARCEQGVVSVSRLATIPVPCHGPPAACTCPWERAASCPGACAADSVEVVMEKDRAAAQLCAPAVAAPPYVLQSPAAVAGAPPCQEGSRFECSAGSIVECASGSFVGRCLKGCERDGASADDDRVDRVAAFAILCSR